MTSPLRSTNDGNSGGMSQVPVEAEPTLAKKKPKSWHGVVGTLSIIIGVLGLVCWGCDSVNNAFAGAATSFESSSTVVAQSSNSTVADTGASATANGNSTETAFAPEPVSAAGQGGVLDIVIGFVSFLLSIMLLVGGIGLVNRKPWSRSTLIFWAWLKILLTIIWIIVYFSLIDDQIPMIQEEMRRSMQEQGNGDQAEVFIGWIKPIITTIIILMGLFLLAWPLFLVFFLGRDKIKNETDGWGGGLQQDIDGWNGG